jgi:hypothetical protein
LREPKRKKSKEAKPGESGRSAAGRTGNRENFASVTVFDIAIMIWAAPTVDAFRLCLDQ